MNEIKQECMIFTGPEWEQTIFTVCKWERTILQYAHFQDLTRNDWKMTEKWLIMNGEISFMTVNDWYHPFSLC